MNYHLADGFVLKWLETPAVYDIRGDELYELDDEAFEFLRECASPEGGRNGAGREEFLDYCLSGGILAPESVPVKSPLLMQSPLPSLRYLELQITDRCNLKCRHCYIGKKEFRELSLQEVEGILNEFEEMQGLRLLVTGGEPLLHSRFREINALLPRYRFRKILFTNGLLLKKEDLEMLNVDEIQFSVDGLEYGHDLFRGKGTYRVVMQRVEDALAAGIPVSVATMVHRENLKEFGAMEALFQGIGIRDWTVDVPCVTGNLKDNPMLQVLPETAGRYLNYGFGGGVHGGGDGYACGLHLVSVLADGNVCKCTFYSHAPSGRIAEGLRNCWAKTGHVQLERLECAALSCPVIDACRGGCRFRAECSHQDCPGDSEDRAERGLRRDFYKCYGYGIIKQSGHEARE